MLRFELSDLEFDGDQAGETTVEEKQIEREIPPSDLERHFAAGKAKIATHLGQETAHVEQQALV